MTTIKNRVERLERQAPEEAAGLMGNHPFGQMLRRTLALVYGGRDIPPAPDPQEVQEWADQHPLAGAFLEQLRRVYGGKAR